jgi:LmbE family N-acetylglucosaminyl deacetylase
MIYLTKRKVLVISSAIILIFLMLYWLFTYIKLPTGEVNGNRILIVSPHPDDESIATAGVISHSLTNGQETRIVLMTYGDGFKKAAQVFTGKQNPAPEDYLLLGRTRKQETTLAMTLLGLSPGKITFLGYPDSALEILWDSQWDDESIKPSGGTEVDRVPYDDAYKPGALYSGQSVVDALSDIISEYQPTEIYYPDPSDDHPDHWATSAFVRYTLTALKYNCTEQTYLVHRNLWPQPDLEEPSKPLLPPEELLNVGTNWVDFTLTKREITLKKLAMRQYTTQEAVMEPFLWAFIRSTELFGQEPDLIISEGGAGLKDPRSDTVRRFLEGSGDITVLKLAFSGSDLVITIETRAAISANITYLLGLRIFNENNQVIRIDFQADAAGLKTPLKSANSITPEIKSFKINGNQINLVIGNPSPAHSAKMLVGAQTFDGSIPLDKTAWRVFDLIN